MSISSFSKSQHLANDPKGDWENGTYTSLHSTVLDLSEAAHRAGESRDCVAVGMASTKRSGPAPTCRSCVRPGTGAATYRPRFAPGCEDVVLDALVEVA